MPQPKTADAVYLTTEHRAWRKAVIDRAGGRCQALDDGVRCVCAEPRGRCTTGHERERLCYDSPIGNISKPVKVLLARTSTVSPLRLSTTQMPRDPG